MDFSIFLRFYSRIFLGFLLTLLLIGQVVLAKVGGEGPFLVAMVLMALGSYIFTLMFDFTKWPRTKKTAVFLFTLSVWFLIHVRLLVFFHPYFPTL